MAAILRPLPCPPCAEVPEDMDLANAEGAAIHGADASYPRPGGFISVIWQGTVFPLNAIDGDFYVNTT